MAQKVRAYFEGLSKKWLCDMLFCHGVQTRRRALVPGGFAFCGYDLGPGTNDLYCYSAVYNEVIYGPYGDLREQSSLLNEHLLFGDLQDAQRFLKVRQCLASNGADLEEGDAEGTMPIFAVYGAHRADEKGV